jgi:fatty acid desaturase
MKLHKEEFQLAQTYNQTTQFEGLSPLQIRNIRERGRSLHRWFVAHRRTHFLINLAVIVFLLSADALTLLWLPQRVASGADTAGWLLGSLLVGSLHGWWLYSLSVFSIHEGASHQMIFPPKGTFSRWLNFLANNLCRLAGAEPVNYIRHHQSHHAHFGSERDGEFLNAVQPRRFWRSLLPWGVFFNHSDFVVHRPLAYTRSYVGSVLVHLGYTTLYGIFMAQSFRLLFTVLSLLVVMPHFAFYLDRLRQFTEHNLMPLENNNGARSFGPGFWGLLIGGGPWGQPCHWMHHLAPQLPWYQQLILHGYVRRLLTPTQRQQFLLPPIIGFPQLCWQLWRTASAPAPQTVTPPATTSSAHLV